MNKNIGDILISFHPSDKVLPTRSKSPWREEARFDESRVMVTDADEKWRGFPLRTFLDEQWQVWVLGEFYGDQQPDLLQALEESLDLNGHFLVIAYEKGKEHWHILTDRFGTVHAYLADAGKRAAFGTFSPAVATTGSVKQLDWEAIAGFFTFGFFLSDKTYWRGLRIVKPATHMVLDQHGNLVSEARTWRWHHEPDLNLSYDDALAEFGELFEIILCDQVRGKAVALPLSGGLDSRSTLVPLTGADMGGTDRLFPFSYGYSKNSVEMKIARQLAHERYLPLQTWTIQPYLFDQIERVLGAAEGFHDLTLPRQAFVIDRLGKEASHVLAAHWGDVWLDDMGFLNRKNPVSDRALARDMAIKFAKNGSQLLLGLFEDLIPKGLSALNEIRLQETLQPLHSVEDIDFKVKAWKTQNWSFRWTLGSLRSYQGALYPLLPFYDLRLVDFFLKLPSDWVEGRAFQIDYIKRYAPDLARVEWQPYGANLNNYQHFNTWLIPKRALAKLGRKLSGKQIIQRNWELQFLGETGRAGLRKWLLSPDLKIHNFISKEKLADFLKDFYTAPDAGNGYAVSMLLTFSAWLEVYA